MPRSLDVSGGDFEADAAASVDVLGALLEAERSELVASAVEIVVRDSHPARMVPGPARDDNIPADRIGKVT